MSNSMQINQAVILCGGLGTRLAPVTDTIPKPMVDIYGKPFLLHMVEQLKKQGISKILLLTGYKKEKIKEYFGNGEQFKIQIDYSEGPVEWETGKRLREAFGQLEDRFFLMYGDNYYNFSLGDINSLSTNNKSDIALLVTPKNPGNISIGANGIVNGYDEKRSTNHEYVEIGFMVINKNVIRGIDPQANQSFSKTLQIYGSNAGISGLKALDAYYSVSDIGRLEILRKFIEPKKIILIDRDGTIHEKSKNSFYITSPDQIIYIEDAIKGLKLLANNGYKFLVITNQAGIATEDLTESQLDTIHLKIKSDLALQGIDILEFYYSPAHWKETNNFFRKPNPGMFFLASKEHKIPLSSTFYIGDDQRDILAAKNANTNGIFYGNIEELVDTNMQQLCCYSSTNMIEIAKFILKESQESV